MRNAHALNLTQMNIVNPEADQFSGTGRIAPGTDGQHGTRIARPNQPCGGYGWNNGNVVFFIAVYAGSVLP
ncbi:hypothetical protein JCM25156A_22680 [Komagataeibacter kakiaceti JCM 25156]